MTLWGAEIKFDRRTETIAVEAPDRETARTIASKYAIEAGSYWLVSVYPLTVVTAQTVQEMEAAQNGD